MEKAMKDWTNYLFYGLAAVVIILTYFATNELETRLTSIETQINNQHKMLKDLTQGRVQ
tara:strand:+ start:1068 stop:1244 length:177 start_codon:yes stop_codon:yes gene_type:complete